MAGAPLRSVPAGPDPTEGRSPVSGGGDADLAWETVDVDLEQALLAQRRTGAVVISASLLDFLR